MLDDSGSIDDAVLADTRTRVDDGRRQNLGTATDFDVHADNGRGMYEGRKLKSQIATASVQVPAPICAPDAANAVDEYNIPWVEICQSTVVTDDGHTQDLLADQ
jgi:hypothetical protein